MWKTSSSKRIVVAIAVLSLVVPAAWAKNGKKASERMFTFGDSLSDAGNHFEEFREVSKAPFEPVPSFSYAIGGHHFSNGDTWIEQLTKRLGKATSGHPASRSPGVLPCPSSPKSNTSEGRSHRSFRAGGSWTSASTAGTSLTGETEPLGARAAVTFFWASSFDAWPNEASNWRSSVTRVRWSAFTWE